MSDIPTFSHEDESGDDRLVAELARLARERDPVPRELVDSAKESFTWRTVDAELAELVADSFQADEVGSLVRSGSAEVRLLTFETRHLTLELQILPAGSALRLVGEVDPPCRASVTVEHGDAVRSGETDELGRFLISDVPAGRARVRCEPAGPDAAPPLVTPWVDL